MRTTMVMMLVVGCLVAAPHAGAQGDNGASEEQTKCETELKARGEKSSEKAHVAKAVGEESGVGCGKSAQGGDMDLSVPQSPAFAVLGVTPKEVIRPESAKRLAAALLQGVDANGNLQTGIAIDTAPFMLWSGKTMTFADYRDSLLERNLARTQLSIATTKGASDKDESVRLALGLRLTPWDDADPRMNDTLIACIGQNLKRPEIEAKIKLLDGDMAVAIATNNEAEQTRINKELLEQRDIAAAFITKCRTARKDHRDNAAWNGDGFRLSLGAAPTWLSENGGFNNLEWSGLGVWSTFSYGFESPTIIKNGGQILLHTRYRTEEMIPDPNKKGSFIEQDSWSVATQLRLAGPDIPSLGREGGPDLNFFVDLSYTAADRKVGKDMNSFRWAAGAEYRLTDDTYLQLTLGTDAADGGNSFILANLAWSLNQSKTKPANP